MNETTFDEAIEMVLARDPRYPRDAYVFLREALEFTQKAAAREHRGPHVTGQELLAGIREFALAQFGPMAITVLEEWGIKRCEDFGEIVFNMVETRHWGKTEKDSREDFQNGYDFDEAFRKPFLPRNKRDFQTRPEPKTSKA